MRLLLDTQIFLWFDSGNPRLDAPKLSAISDPNNDVFLSIASIWECVVKHQIGKLKLARTPEVHLPSVRDKAGIGNLSIEDSSLVELAKLPLIHRDPFDRLIVAHANQHGLTLMTEDAILRQYPVTCF